MHPAVPYQVTPLTECLGTVLAPVRSLARVSPHVTFDKTTGSCCVGAQAAPEPPGRPLRRQRWLTNIGYNQVTKKSELAQENQLLTSHFSILVISTFTFGWL